MKNPFLCHWRMSVGVFLVTTGIILTACSSPLQSQRYFERATLMDPLLVTIHSTPLYTVYYDHALRRCILHSSYTWGESGGGTGGTGIGVEIFACDPARLKEYVDTLRTQVDAGKSYFPLPRMRPPSATPSKPVPNKSPAEVPPSDVPSVAPAGHKMASESEPAELQPVYND